jgi:hypothetical protein
LEFATTLGTNKTNASNAEGVRELSRNQSPTLSALATMGVFRSQGCANPGLKLANAFGVNTVTPERHLAFGVNTVTPERHLAFGVNTVTPEQHLAFGVNTVTPERHLAFGVDRLLPNTT